MKLFNTIAATLDAQIPALAVDMGMTQRDLYKKMKEVLVEMTAEWTSGSQPDIAYSDPICRIAYIYCHVAINANLLTRALETSFKNTSTGKPSSLGKFIIRRLNKNARIRVCAFGGGPGTELLALSKYLVQHPIDRQHVDLELVLLDRVQEWAESWEALKEAIYSQFTPLDERPFSISSSVFGFDMTNIKNYGTVHRILNRDLFVLNYVVSEVFDPALLQNLADVVKTMRAKSTGARFLILDRNDARTKRTVTELMFQAGLKELHRMDVGGTMDRDEQKEVLETYSDQIGMLPRVQWRTRTGTPSAFFTIAK